MMRGLRPLAAVLCFVILSGAAWAVHARNFGATPALAASDTTGEHAPLGVRIRVEVVNTTGIRGLGRRATRALRDRGYDVVEVKSGTPKRDSTLVLDRSHHPEWARSVARALGPTVRAEARPDSSRYLDVTVLLGSSWSPPAQPLDP